jgi:hypothetical protein
MIDTSSAAFKAVVAVFLLTALSASRFSINKVSQGIVLHSLETKPLLASQEALPRNRLFL